jgi:hypothetical protein
MKPSCPTIQYIQTIAKAAAEMGEPSCDVVLGGVRVTVHVAFESPIPREVALGLVVTPRGRFMPNLHSAS